MVRKAKSRKGRGRKVALKNKAIGKCEDKATEDVTLDELEEEIIDPQQDVLEDDISDNPSKKLKINDEVAVVNSSDHINGIYILNENLDPSPINIQTPEHVTVNKEDTLLDAFIDSTLDNSLTPLNDKIKDMVDSNMDIVNSETNDKSSKLCNGEIDNELEENSKIIDFKIKDVTLSSQEANHTQPLQADPILQNDNNNNMHNGIEHIHTNISINNLGSDSITLAPNLQNENKSQINYQSSKVEVFDGPISAVDLDDNHFLRDINSISESSIKTLDVVTYIEHMTSENQKIYEELLLNKLYFARNCFAKSPPEWYEYFEQLQHYHQEILKNITDFNIWVSLLQYSESLLRNPRIIQEAKQHIAVGVLKNSFDEFLQRYPYCYGYWKNYADIVKKFGNMDDVYKIYERALENFPNSVDLWVFFINFVIENSHITNEKFTPKSIENLLEKAVKMVGSDYKSEPLWDLYITWEMRSGNMRKVTEVLDMAIKKVTAAYKQFFERFKNHVETNDLHDILNEEELEKMKKALNISSQPVPSYNYHPFNHLSDVMIKYKFYEMPDDQIIAIREKLIETREEIMNEVEGEFKRRKTFEDNIKRPYFHIKPLERNQLKNWSAYLDFELAQVPDVEKGEAGLLQKRERVQMLFERCLITCALYEEFWIKYARYLENIDIEAMRKVFQRACFVHLETHPNPFLTWSALEEKYGNLKATTFLLNLINRNVPGLVQVNLRLINLERRHGDPERVEHMYRDCLTRYESNLCYYSFFAINFARYMHKVLNNKPQAIKLLEDALNNDPHNEKLYLQLIDIQYQSYPLDVDQIITTFDKALNGTLPDTSKTAFAQRKYEFLENFDTDVVRINKARDDFLFFLKNQLGGEFSSAIQKSYVKGNVPVVASAIPVAAPAVAVAPPVSTLANAGGKGGPAGAGGNDYYTAAYYQQWAAASAYSYPSPLAYPAPAVAASQMTSMGNTSSTTPAVVKK